MEDQQLAPFTLSVCTENCASIIGRLPHEVANVVLLAGEELHSKEAIMDAFAQALRFPSYFGRNWDALVDCLSDLGWLKHQETAICVDLFQPSYDRRALVQLLDILASVMKEWQSRSIPFYVLVCARPERWESAVALLRPLAVVRGVDVVEHIG